MKTLLTILLVLSGYFAQAQCNSVCETCTTPFAVTTSVHNGQLFVCWNHNWYWGYGCSKSVAIYVDGIRYTGSNGALWSPAVSCTAINLFPVAGQQYCVVVRNYCSSPWPCDSLNFADSPPLCVTPVAVASPTPAPTPVSASLACDCIDDPNKYTITKPGKDPQCVPKSVCRKRITQGWTSSCNCN